MTKRPKKDILILSFDQQCDLINEIKQRPHLWNTNYDGYKRITKEKKQATWNQVAGALVNTWSITTGETITGMLLCENKVYLCTSLLCAVSRIVHPMLPRSTAQ